MTSTASHTTPDTFAWLRDAMGPDMPIDIQLQGGEHIRLGPSLTVEVLNLPGHTPGPRRRSGSPRHEQRS